MTIAKFRVHFDGPITVDHKVSLRVLSKTYENMQRSIDRAYLVEKYGHVWKYARLKSEDYLETDFLAEYPLEGGIILDAVKDGAGKIIDSIANTIRAPYERALIQGEEFKASLDAQLHDRREYAFRRKDTLERYEELLKDPDSRYVRAYSERSVAKEIVQLVSQVDNSSVNGSYVEIDLYGTKQHPRYIFDRNVAANFKKIVSDRELGAPLVIPVAVRLLDKGNNYQGAKAKVLNLATGREEVLYLSGQADFDKLHPLHKMKCVYIVACPVVEFGAFDPQGGDLFFIDVF